MAPHRLVATAAAIDMGAITLVIGGISRAACASCSARNAAASAAALAARSARSCCSARVGRPFLTDGGIWQGMPSRLHSRQGYSRLQSTLLERHAASKGEAREEWHAQGRSKRVSAEQRRGFAQPSEEQKAIGAQPSGIWAYQRMAAGACRLSSRRAPSSLPQQPHRPACFASHRFHPSVDRPR